MKTVLVALNARYSHSSLALLYIQKNNMEFEPEIFEFSINDSVYSIYKTLLESSADVYCFSCYIWNIDMVLKVAELIKKAKPKSFIIFGGPESGYNSDYLLENFLFIDTIIKGDGEDAIGEVLLLIKKGKTPDRFIDGKPADIDNPIQPYTASDIRRLNGKIIYFETSRGCPLNCSYCLSSSEQGVRYFPMDYVKNGFNLFFDEEVPLVKLIDRTFNSSEERAIEIIEFIIKNSKVTRVHFEIEAQILTEKLIDALRNAPKDMFQLEIGIQSTNLDALKSVNRRFDSEKTRNNILKLNQNNNIHIHLDLIAGLPYEDYHSFRESFNYVYSLSPDMLQLGFLKMLKGTDINRYQNEIISADFAPYEVISTKWLSSTEILRLKQVEEAVDVFYNSGCFKNTISKLDENSKDDPFKLFEELGEILDIKTKLGKIKRSELYSVLYEKYGDMIINELAVDFIMNNKTARLPSFLERMMSKDFKKKCKYLVDNDRFINETGITNGMKDLRFEHILGKVYVMDYSQNKFCDITEWFEN